ncbi:MAG: SDR family oxidoreductase [Fibrobacter sp.]|nr:SDR family oxidoreductase [Fibrobacter sp.]
MRKTAVITGGARGIGYELARQFANDGYDLILVSRNRDKLKAAATLLTKEYSVQVQCCGADLSDAASHKIVADAVNNMGVIPDVLVNNAGVGASGTIVSIDYLRQMEMVNLNVGAVVGLTRTLLPGMIGRGSGAILNVASTAAFFPGPNMAVYYATKSFVLNFSLALEKELENSGVRVSVLCPGPTATDFGADSGLDNIKLVKRKYFPLMPVENVAKYGYRKFRDGKVIIVPGIANRISTTLSSLIPRRMSAGILKMLNNNEQLWY